MRLSTCADSPEHSLLADTIFNALAQMCYIFSRETIEKLKSCRHLSQHLNYIFLQINEGWNGVNIIGQRHETSNNVVCATSKGSDQPVHTHSLIRAFASRLNIL